MHQQLYGISSITVVRVRPQWVFLSRLPWSSLHSTCTKSTFSTDVKDTVALASTSPDSFASCTPPYFHNAAALFSRVQQRPYFLSASSLMTSSTSTLSFMSTATSKSCHQRVVNCHEDPFATSDDVTNETSSHHTPSFVSFLIPEGTNMILWNHMSLSFM